MKTLRKNFGPFSITQKSIRATLRDEPATLICERQTGMLPSGKGYQTRLLWWIKMDGSLKHGPFSAQQIRTLAVRA
jgi:hypothetical protein